jgi:hypothetical protein
MPVSGEELVTLLIAFAATALVVFGIRRASQRSQLGEGAKRSRPKLQERAAEAADEDENKHKADEDLDEDADDDSALDSDNDEFADAEQEEVEVRKKKKAKQKKPAPATAEESEDLDEQRRLDAGLEKTRSSGFVSRLGKLFARK